MNIERKIERAASGLDVIQPDWATRIDLDLLDMGSNRRCVLGQVYGRYGWHPYKVDTRCGMAAFFPMFKMRRATIAWKTEIAARAGSTGRYRPINETRPRPKGKTDRRPTLDSLDLTDVARRRFLAASVPDTFPADWNDEPATVCDLATA